MHSVPLITNYWAVPEDFVPVTTNDLSDARWASGIREGSGTPLDLDYHSLIIYHLAVPEDCVCIALLRLLDTRWASRLDGFRGKGRNSLVCMNIFGQRSDNTTSIRQVQRLDVRLDCDWAATRLRLGGDWTATGVLKTILLLVISKWSYGI